MVPSGWELKSLDCVSKVIDCKHRTPKYVVEGIPLVSPGTIKWGAIDLVTPTKRVSSEEYISLMDHCTVNIGDLVLSRNQSVGVAAFVESDEPFVLGQDTVLVKPTEADSKFLFYNLQSVETQRTIFKLAGGSTFSRINLGDIRKLKAIYPPLAEQRKIAKILSTWDNAISTTERLIDNSKQQKKALMQQLLTGKKRFAGYTKDWKQIQLGDIGKCITGLTYKPSDTADEGMLVLRSSNIQDSKLSFDDNVFVNTDLKVKSKTQENDILVCVRNGSKHLIGKSTLIKGKAVGQAHGAFMTLFRGKYPLYVSQLFQSDEFFRQVNMNLGATINSINTSDLHKFKFSIPTDENEIDAISSCLSNAEKEIEALKQQLADLKQEKRALMQQLLTGKRRVRN